MRMVAAAAALLALTGCTMPVQEPLGGPSVAATDSPPSPPAEPAVALSPSPFVQAELTPPAAPPVKPGAALASLALVPVKGRAPKTGYDRDLFGQAWADVDRNGCDTRNDILARDLTDETFRPGTGDCVVLTGVLADPYTGRTLSFTKDDAGAIQIDHVVALSDAWQKGAQQWPPDKRMAFANDPLNLLAVDGPTNASKSDGDAATWLPPNKGYRCAMVARQAAVKVKYGLWVTQAERDAIARVLFACPGEPLPTGGSVPAAALPAPTKPPSPPNSSRPGQGGTDPNYGSCRQAKANGAGPYVRGRDPEYAHYRDGDSDGTVCE